MAVRRRDGRPFTWLLAANTSAALGDGLMSGALPLLIAAATTSPVVVSLLQAAIGLPWLMFGLLAGVVVDRVDRRTLLWRTELARVFVAGAFCILVLAGHAGVGLILGTAFVLAASSTLIRSAVPALVPRLIDDRTELAAANGRLQTGTIVTGSFIGPAAGGLLHALGPWVPFLGQAISFTASYACLRQVRSDRPVAVFPSSGRPTWTTDLRDGLRYLWRHHSLRPLAIGTLGITIAMGLVLGILVLHIVNALHLPGPTYGLVLSAEAAGSLIGSAGLPLVVRRLLVKRSLVTAGLLATLSLGILYLGTTLPTVLASMLILGVATMMWNVTAVTTRQQCTPDALLGRVSSTFNVLGIGGASAAAPLGGLIAAAAGTSTTILTAAAVCAAATTYLAVALPRIVEDGPKPTLNVAS